MYKIIINKIGKKEVVEWIDCFGKYYIFFFWRFIRYGNVLKILRNFVVRKFF